MLKLGPHHMTGGSATGAWLKLWPSVAKFVGDLGASVEALPGTLTIGRVVDIGRLDGQGFDMNRQAWVQTPEQAADQYVAFLLPYIRSNPAILVWEGPNEQNFINTQTDVQRQQTMSWYANFGYQFALRLAQYGKRAGLGSWATGNPIKEYGLWPWWNKALQATVDFKAIICRHDYADDVSGLLRSVYDNSQFERMGFFGVPQVNTELACKDPGPGWLATFGSIEGYYTRLLVPLMNEMAKYPWWLGATLYTDGGTSQWRDKDVSGTRIVSLLAGYKPPEGVSPMDDTVRQQALAALLVAQAKNQESGAAMQTAIDTLKAAAPVGQPWYTTTPVPFVAFANKLPLTTYVAPGGQVKDVRPLATYPLDVSQVQGDWLCVAPNLWVKAADVHLKA